jgi:AAA domain
VPRRDNYEDILAYETHVRIARDKIEEKLAEEKAMLEAFVLGPKRMDEFVAETDEETQWRIDGVAKVGGNNTIVAKNKTGKSTLMMNVLHSLADGVPFLGEIPVRPPERNIMLWNMELSESVQRDWCRRIGIEHQERIIIENLRGRRQPLYSKYTQDTVIEYLKRNEVDVWVIDPAARLLGGWPGSSNPENDNSVATDLTDILDEIKGKAGVSDLFMPLHTGRESDQRSRGAIRWDDWPDSIMLLYIDLKILEGEKTRRLATRGRDVVEFDKVLNYSGDKTKRYSIVNNIEELSQIVHARSVIRVLCQYPMGLPQETLMAKLLEVGVARDGRLAAINLASARGWLMVVGGLTLIDMNNPEARNLAIEYGGI